MSIRITFILFIAVVTWWIWSVTKPAAHPSPRAQHEVVVEPVPTNQKFSSQLPPRAKGVQVNQTPTPPVPTKKSVDEKPPGEWDAFARRKLNKRKPKSITDLKNHLTTYVDPLLDDGRHDGDVTSWYRGYYVQDNGELARIEFDRAPGPMSLKIERSDGSVEEWAEDKFKVWNFESDPYSLVIAGPGGISVYLKFVTNRDLSGVNDENPGHFRVYEGWMLPSGMPLIMLDQFEPLANDLDRWPKPEGLRKYLQTKLPQK